CGAVEGYGRAFGHGLIGTSVDHRSVIDRIDGQRHDGDVAVEAAVVGLVGEAVRSVVVCARSVAEGPIGIQIQSAVGRTTDEHGTQRGAIHVAVVAEHAAGGGGERLGLGEGGGVVGGRGPAVHG